MPRGGEYFVARLHGDDVAGIATLPPGGVAEPAWTTYVRVDTLEGCIDRVVAAGGAVVVAPVEAPPAGRLAIVQSPAGASFGLWEPGARIGAQRINEPGAWAMSTLRSRDLQAAAAFYATVFGWKPEPFDAGGRQGALFRLPDYVGGLPQQPVPRDVVAVAFEDNQLDADHWTVDFWIDDVDAALERVATGGGSVIAPSCEAAMFRRAVVACPAGAVFTISQLVTDRLGADAA
jgi:hypothetical protein